MISTRGKWLRTLLAGLIIASASSGAPIGLGTRIWAGPIPAVQLAIRGVFNPARGLRRGSRAERRGVLRGGVRGANQFQDYLSELQGISRAGVERYGIGMPYFRRAVDPKFDKAGNREYRPNRKSERAFRGYAAVDHTEIPRLFRGAGPQEASATDPRLQPHGPQRLSRALGHQSTKRVADPGRSVRSWLRQGYSGATGRQPGLTAIRRGSPRGTIDDDRAGDPPPLRGRRVG